MDQSQMQEHKVNKILSVTMVILFIITIGFGGFVLYSINQVKVSTPASVDTKKIVVSPTASLTENPNDVDIGSVEADLKSIEPDVNSLQ